MALFIDFSVICILIGGIRLFREPRKARIGNLAAALAMLCAFGLVLYRHGILDGYTVTLSLIAGAIAGCTAAIGVNMIQIPAMVAFQNGAGGAAALFVSMVELMRDPHPEWIIWGSGLLVLTVGALTFSGSMIAGAKLAGWMHQPPRILRAHDRLVLAAAAALLIVGAVSSTVPAGLVLVFYLGLILLAAVLGILISIRIGGADMPVLISFLNAMTGAAAALCGMVISNQLLIAFGAAVAASGTVLTRLMCKAMNRNILRVFWPERKEREDDSNGKAAVIAFPGQAAEPDTAREAGANSDHLMETAVERILDARTVIIIPGYGMALAKAQQGVAALARKMTELGKEVKYAIHPVAGRMPGHMNVLLAEAGVDYDMLVEMDEINPRFGSTDLVLIIGACDVVNPAAIEVEGTPISGMPILMAHKAGHAVCCNLDTRPGYSGVENPLYEKPDTTLLLGDAGSTVQKLLEAVSAGKSQERTETERTPDAVSEAVKALASAGRVVIIPGYGMALANAQYKTAELARLLVQNGASVRYAIHPVAGRMPGHMNVILAEAEVEYDELIEMEAANPLFNETDVALVIGACDVVNPAAVNSEGTPISGMPILTAYEAKRIIVCNLDEKPGYSGVSNSLYENAKTITIWGDAKSSVMNLISNLRSEGEAQAIHGE